MGSVGFDGLCGVEWVLWGLMGSLRLNGSVGFDGFWEVEWVLWGLMGPGRLYGF